MADVMVEEPQQAGTKIMDEKVRAVLSGFRRYRSIRQKKWDKIADRCLRFVWGDQWSSEHKRKLEIERRAPSVFNQVLPVASFPSAVAVLTFVASVPI